MKSVMASPSIPQLDRLVNGKAHNTVEPAERKNLTAEKKKPSETLTERFRELAVILFQ